MVRDHTAGWILHDGEIVVPLIAALRGIRRGYCPRCGGRVYSCQNRRGVDPYFAHVPVPGRRRQNTETSESESDLHRFWRLETAGTLKRMVAVGAPLIVDFPCRGCGRRHQMNFLDGATAVLTGHVCTLPSGAGSVNPDIAIARGPTVDRVLEGVRSHPISPATLDHYRRAHVMTLEVGVGLRILPEPTEPYRVWLAAYRGRRLTGEVVRSELMCRLHGCPMQCTSGHAEMRKGRPHFSVVAPDRREVCS